MNFVAAPVQVILAGVLLSGPGIARELPGEPTPAHLPTNEDLRHIRSISNPRLSPDGRLVLVQIADSTADGAHSHLWLVDIERNESRQITYSLGADPAGEQSGRWMPDGRSVLFLAKRSEHTQLFRLPMAGGEALAYALTVEPQVDSSNSEDAIALEKSGAGKTSRDPLPLDVEGFEAAPDGKHIALIARDPETSGEKEQREKKADAVARDHDLHGRRLYLLDPQSGKLALSAVAPDVIAVSWASQGDRLVVVTEEPNGLGDLGPGNRAWIVQAGDPQHPKGIATAPTTIGDCAWSLDGSQIYFLAQSGKESTPGYADLYSLKVDDGTIRNLSADLDGSIADSPLPTQDGVLLLVQHGTRAGYQRFEGRDPRTVDARGLVPRDLDTNAVHSGWVWLGGSSSEPDALFYVRDLGSAPRRLDTARIAPEGTTFPGALRVHWSSDGFDIEGLLYLPAIREGQKVPMILDVHGGPTGAWLDSFDPLPGYLVGQGWAVLRPNPRGSTGRGVTFEAANRNDLGGGDFRDVMAGVDFALANFPIDPGRLALIGYSYGGEMAGFAEGKTDRFRAIVSGAPVIDQHSEYGTEQFSWYDRWFYGKPWEHPADAWRQSPIAYVHNAKTPFLLLQGRDDHVDPAGQSLEMYRALRQSGVKVELVEYPREDHGPLSDAIHGRPSPEPWHGFDARRRIVAFIRSAFENASGPR